MYAYIIYVFFINNIYLLKIYTFQFWMDNLQVACKYFKDFHNFVICNFIYLRSVLVLHICHLVLFPIPYCFQFHFPTL